MYDNLTLIEIEEIITRVSFTQSHIFHFVCNKTGEGIFNILGENASLVLVALFTKFFSLVRTSIANLHLQWGNGLPIQWHDPV
jgi:hypothetical protein